MATFFISVPLFLYNAFLPSLLVSSIIDRTIVTAVSIVVVTLAAYYIICISHLRTRLNLKLAVLRVPFLFRRRRRNQHNSNINAAQPYDYETRLSDLHISSFYKLKVGIIGFGNFGQFLAKTIVHRGHTVLAHSRSNYSQVAARLGVAFYSDPHDLFEEHPEVILLCTSILSTESVLLTLPLQRLRRSTLFVDVLSVKEFPRNLFLDNLPQDFDILCTHPMFGPESGKNGWNGLPFVYDKVRIGNHETRMRRCENFIDIFRREGCRMVEMTCAEHDRYAASSQFITHMMGRVLEKLALEETPINTKGYETLLKLVDNTAKDSCELFYGLFQYNRNAMAELERMELAFGMVKDQLFGTLQSRSQYFKESETDNVKERKLLTDSSHNGAAMAASTESLEVVG